MNAAQILFYVFMGMILGSIITTAVFFVKFRTYTKELLSTTERVVNSHLKTYAEKVGVVSTFLFDLATGEIDDIARTLLGNTNGFPKRQLNYVGMLLSLISILDTVFLSDITMDNAEELLSKIHAFENLARERELTGFSITVDDFLLLGLPSKIIFHCALFQEDFEYPTRAW